MNLSQYAASTGLAAICALLNSGTITLYQGAIPISPESAIGSQVKLAPFTFGTAAFGSPAYTSQQEVANANLAASSVTPSAAGVACFARAMNSAGNGVVADLTVGSVWAPSAPVIAGQYVVSGGNTYVCTSAGTTGTSGPSGTGTSITDGTAVWTWNNTGAPDIVMQNTSLSTGVPVTVQSCAFAISAL